MMYRYRYLIGNFKGQNFIKNIFPKNKLKDLDPVLFNERIRRFAHVWTDPDPIIGIQTYQLTDSDPSTGLHKH